MAKTNAVDPSSPAGSSDRRQGDDAIRDQAKGIAETMNVDHYMGADGGIGSGYNEDAAGEHAKVTLRVGSAPTGEADKGFIKAIDKNGKAELHYIDEDDQSVQMTSGGNLGSALTPVLASTLSVAGVATLTDTAVLASGASCGSKVLSAVADPVANQDAATKVYADASPNAQMKADNVAGATFGAGSESSTEANGKITKTGTVVDGGGSGSVGFGVDFPGGVLSLQMTQEYTQAATTAPTYQNLAVGGFDWKKGTGPSGFSWTAIGY